MDRRHPLVAVLAVAAIFLAMLLITWARIAIHGTDDLQSALLMPPAQADAERERVDATRERERDVDAAVTSSRFATGFSP
jgi:hypothetical protein